MVVKQCENMVTLSCEGSDRSPRPKPAMPDSRDVKMPLLFMPQPKRRLGTATSLKVKVSWMIYPSVTELSA
jgi:hypothetical protein